MSQALITVDKIDEKDSSSVEKLEFRKIPLSPVREFYGEFLVGENRGIIKLDQADNVSAYRLDITTYGGIICLRKINHVRYLNKYFESINRALLEDGIYIGCAETNYQLRKRLKEKYSWYIYYPFFLVHFIVKRILPRWAVSKRFYFYITRGKNRVISLTELLGRLVSCGFEILEYKSIDGLTYYAVKRTVKPAYEMDPTYGPVVGLKRVGKDGKIIRMYKFRTMHPYAEFIQGYVYERSGLDRGDKIINDFRVTAWGAFLRKYWIDELPMLINLLKGDIKLVGVRPLSKHKLSLYSETLRELRNRNKPGLIPPYYADMPQDFDGLQESEYNYLINYSKNPIKTDVKYFFRAVYNILIKRARSG